MILAVGSLTIIAVAASLFPAISATAVDPIQVLSEE
jgi:ABC-type antimicrobial peptide transport system permease subunit